MSQLSERVAARLREEICKVCIYQTADGGCGLRSDLDCPILSRVDQIIDIVRQVDDPRIDPYVEKLREAVCADCQMQDEGGNCRMRNKSDCALDDYFALIVQIVEDEME